MADPLERFTPSAQEVLRFAQIEAKRMHHATIGPEHILLGLMLEGEGIAGRVLRDMGLRPSAGAADCRPPFQCQTPG